MTAARAMLTGIYAHGRFANDRILDLAVLLSDEELNREWPGMSEPIRISLLHMFGAHLGWLEHVGAFAPVDLWPDGPPSLPELRVQWAALDAQTLDYLDTLSDEQLLERIRMESPGNWEIEAPRWQALVHQAFHQHQHRSEVAAMLTALGHSPGDLDPFDIFEVEGTMIDVTAGP
jgi:uncharacterized damage-inducible protein DinB